MKVKDRDGMEGWDSFLVFCGGRLGHGYQAPVDWLAGNCSNFRFLFSLCGKIHTFSSIIHQLTFSLIFLSHRTLDRTSGFHIVVTLTQLVDSTMLRFAAVRSLSRVSVFPRAMMMTRTASSYNTAPVATKTMTPSPFVRSRQFLLQFQPSRHYSAPAGLSKEEVEGRIVNLLKNFDKVFLFLFLITHFTVSCVSCGIEGWN